MLSHQTAFASQFAFFLGALHALEPGHGKTALFAYMAGGKHKIVQPVVIGVTTAITHTISILAITLVTHLLGHVLAGEGFRSESIVSCLSWVSGFTILGIGLFLGVRAWIGRPVHVCGSGCGHHGPAVAETSTFSSPKVGALLGVGAGLIPCPSAMAAYFSSLGTGNTISGVWMVITYGLGIAVALSLLGVGFLLGGTKLRSRFKFSEKSRRHWAMAQSLIIVAVGVIYVWRSYSGSPLE